MQLAAVVFVFAFSRHSEYLVSQSQAITALSIPGEVPREKESKRERALVVGGTTIGPPDWVQRARGSSRHPHQLLNPLNPDCPPGSFSFSFNSGEPHIWACSSQTRGPWSLSMVAREGNVHSPYLSMSLLPLSHSSSRTIYPMSPMDYILHTTGSLPTALPRHVSQHGTPRCQGSRSIHVGPQLTCHSDTLRLKS